MFTRADKTSTDKTSHFQRVGDTVMRPMQTKALVHAGAFPAIFRPGRRWLTLLLTAAALLLVTAATARAADPASFFWVNKVEGTIGGSALDGGNVNHRLIDLGYFKPTQLAAGGDYVYWLDPALNSIGRAKTDGTSVNRRFITGLATSQADHISGIAVDATHVYWGAWRSGQTNKGRIAQASLDGTSRNDTLIGNLEGIPNDLAVDASHVFWLWADEGQTTIGRATKSGTGISPSFILGSFDDNGWGSPSGITVHNGYVYWTDDPVGKIGRAKTDGTSVQPNFITGLATADSNDRLVGDIVVTDSFIYWQEERANDDDGKYGRIGRATLAGASGNSDFAKTESSPTGLAVAGTGLIWSRHEHSGLARSAIDGSSINEGFIVGYNAVPRSLVADKDYVYWLDGPDNRIARAGRDGSAVTPSFIDVGPYELSDLALGATYIYFTFQSYDYLQYGSGPIGIGRVRRDGTGSADILIGDQQASDIAVSATHLYWTGYTHAAGTTIGRAAIDGTAAQPEYITGFASHSSESPQGLALTESHLYWADMSNRRIGRANLSGTGLTHTFIDNAGESDSLAIDGARLFWNGGTSDNVAGSIAPGTVQVAGNGGLLPPQPFVAVFNPGGTSTYPIGDIAVARTDLTTPVPPPPPPPDPGDQPSNPTPPGQEPAPTSPTQPSGGTTRPSGSGGVTPPTRSKPSAALRARSAKRGGNLVMSLSAVPKGTKLTVAWKPKRGRTTRATYRANGKSLKIRVPKKAGRYTLRVTSNAGSLLSAKVTVQ